MNKETLNKLYEPFELRERKGLGGMVFKYVPSDSVIDRMNRLFKGRWSTVVVDEKAVEDSVLVRVKVRVYDKDNFIHEHEGYGSSMIMRYTSGPNQGKIIDLGNAYKSAESKAIKNACTRWGVGLYLDNKEQNDVVAVGNTKTESFVPPNAEKSVPLVSSSTKVPTFNVGVPSPPKDNTQTNSKVSIPVPPVVETTTTLSQENVKSRESDLPKIPLPTQEPAKQSMVPPVMSTPSVVNSNTSTGGGDISDVQKVALSGLLSLKKVKYEDLVKEAFENSGKAVDNIPAQEELSYEDAVTIIQYGNKLFNNSK